MSMMKDVRWQLKQHEEDLDGIEKAVWEEFNALESKLLKIIIRLEARVAELEADAKG